MMMVMMVMVMVMMIMVMIMVMMTISQRFGSMTIEEPLAKLSPICQISPTPSPKDQITGYHPYITNIIIYHHHHHNFCQLMRDFHQSCSRAKYSSTNIKMDTIILWVSVEYFESK